MKEVWKDIQGYEGFYQVSNLGKVRSVDRSIKYSNGVRRITIGKIISVRIRKKDGYAMVCLCKNQKERTPYLHRIVATHFIDNPENKREVNHKNGNKKDNFVLNLEWATTSENNKHAHDIGLNQTLRGADCHFSKLTKNDVLEIRHLYKTGSLTQREIGERFGVGDANICNIVNNKTWKTI